MNWESTINLEAKSIPGVKFRIRKITEGLRVQLRLHLAEAFGRMRDIEAEREAFHAELAERHGKRADDLLVADLSAEERKRLAGFVERLALIQDAELNAAYYEAAFEAAEGITVDGKAPDAALLRDRGPGELYREIVAAVLREAGLSAEEKANLESPSTSAAAVDGKTSATSAASASGTDSTSSESAGSTSPTGQ